MKKMLKLLLIVAIGVSGIPIAQGATAARVITTQSYTANISGVGNIWKSEIPNSIAFPADESYVELEFPIQGLLPYKTLSDRSTGVDIEFELWSTSGTKIASRSVYSSVWNPAGPDTLISFTLFKKDLFGDLVLRVSTQYKVSTNGLLSRYLSTETKIPFKIEGVTLPTAKVSGATIEGSEDYLGTIPAVGSIWKGKIPTKISYPLDSSYQTAYFYIQGLLPYSTLADKATGVEVEFELWNSKGKKISDDTVYSFDWNPVGLNTMVSLRLSEDDAIGNHTLIIRTIYEVSTTGLLTRYLEQEDKRQVTVVSRKKDQVIEFKQISDISLDKGSFTLYSSDLSSSEYSLKPLLNSATPGVCTASDRKVTLINSGTCTLIASQSGSVSVGAASDVSVSFKVLAGKPRTPTEFTGSRQGNTVIYSIGGGYTGETSFDVSISPILSPTASPTSQSNFYGPAVWKTISGTTFTIDGTSLNSYFNGIILPYSKYKSIVLVRVRAVNSLGSSEWSSGIYSNVRDFGLIESGSSSSKSKTITCAKGTSLKKVTGVNPKCPSGYKKK